MHLIIRSKGREVRDGLVLCELRETMEGTISKRWVVDALVVELEVTIVGF